MMTNFSDLLLPQTVLNDVPAADKKAVLQHLANTAALIHGLDAKTVATVLADRERVGSTGFGGGVAIPHGKLPEIDHVIGVFARLAQPVDFQAIDELPVDIVFMLLSPLDAGADHLKALARVSRRLRDRGFMAKLRGAGSPDALYALWTGDEARDAA
jgi:PTS system nitrogen regulatory IIA component